jgi:hypothetical protein
MMKPRLGVAGNGMGHSCGIDELEPEVGSLNFSYQPGFSSIESESC